MPYAEDNVAVCFATVCSAARSLPLGSPVPQCLLRHPLLSQWKTCDKLLMENDQV